MLPLLLSSCCSLASTSAASVASSPRLGTSTCAYLACIETATQENNNSATPGADASCCHSSADSTGSCDAFMNYDLLDGHF